MVDNASQIGHCGAGAGVAGGHALIANQENRGFAGAVNQGFRATDADFILLLNPDVQLADRDRRLWWKRAGARPGRGPAWSDTNGQAQSGIYDSPFPDSRRRCVRAAGINRLWPSNPVNRHYRYLDRDLDQPGPVEQPAGAFLMIRRDVWERLGGFDERFHPVWFEDVDFCRRAVDAGYQIAYVPQVQAEHQGRAFGEQTDPGCRTSYWCVSLLRYAAKHFRPWAVSRYLPGGGA